MKKEQVLLGVEKIDIIITVAENNMVSTSFGDQEEHFDFIDSARETLNFLLDFYLSSVKKGHEKNK